MATTYYNDIQKLYVAYFNRPADAAGLAYYEGVLEAAKGSATVMAQISADFAKSTEYTAAFSGKTSAQIVDIIYTNIFGHAADAAGNKFYADNLDAKKVSLADVVTEVAKGAQGTDLVAYNAKLQAAAAFTAAVDTDAEKAGYSGADANKVAKAFLASVTDNVSLAAATTPAALNTSVATAVAAGTPFTLAGTLAQITAATKAVGTFVTSVDVDSDASTVTKASDITGAQTTAVTKVAGDLSDTAAATLFSASTTSQAVRDALVANQQAVNAAALSTAQQTLAADNTKIAAVAGLTDAVSALTVAQAALKSAQTAEVSARADITAKEASFGVSNNGSAVTESATALTYVKAASGTTPATTITLATISGGKATLADGVDASKYTGLTELIASYNAEQTALSNVAKAQTNVTNTTLVTNMLDVAADSVGTITANGTAYTETNLIKAIADTINGTTSGTVAAGATPTLAQIQTELAVLKAQTDQTAYTNFKGLVDAEAGAGAAFNPLVAKQAADTTAVSTISTTIKTLATDVAALQAAQANVATLNGLQATVDAYAKVLSDKGYLVTPLDATHTTNFAGAKSDVYTFDAKSTVTGSTIAAFGLQGTDALSVGTDYTLVNGAIGAKGVTGNDAVKEIFVSNNNGDAVLQIETHAYSSNVLATTGEVVTITLTGVDATTLHLNNGIITAG
ncbi:DUF4214 domain-containing protein [Massilia sp. LXY-6]|uniref:DUF4214 domain-containing protein n=1 Tax=Massilia sp. LXY-6 TaxID=3379823 RepID=UPI003EE39B5B